MPLCCTHGREENLPALLELKRQPPYAWSNWHNPRLVSDKGTFSCGGAVEGCVAWLSQKHHLFLQWKPVTIFQKFCKKLRGFTASCLWLCAFLEPWKTSRWCQELAGTSLEQQIFEVCFFHFLMPNSCQSLTQLKSKIDRNLTFFLKGQMSHLTLSGIHSSHGKMFPGKETMMFLKCVPAVFTHVTVLQGRLPGGLHPVI